MSEDIEKQKMILNIAWATIILGGLSFVVFGYSLLSWDRTTLGTIMMVLGLLLIVFGSIIMRNLKAKVADGEILEDERTTQQVYKAGYIAWLASISIWVIVAGFADFFSEVRYGYYLGAFLSLIAFVISLFVLRKYKL